MSILSAIRDAVSSELAPTVLGLNATPETSTLSNPQPWLVDSFGGGPTATGQRVTPESSMRVSAVFGCINVLARSVGQAPLQLMRTTKNGGSEPATDHPLYQVLGSLFNPVMSSQDGLEVGMNHLCLRGYSYYQIVRDQAGRVMQLWPLHPDYVAMRWAEDGSLVYDYYPPGGGTDTFQQNEIWRTVGMTFNGLQGLSPISFAREAIGLAMATEQHGAKLFANGAQLATAFEMPGKIGQEQYDRLKASIDNRFAGSRNAFKSIILEDGMKVSKLSMTSVDSQFIEARKFQLEEICRIYGVPLHKVQSLDKATFNNIEHLEMDFVNSSLMPWLVRFEKTGFRDLLTPQERKRLFLRFDTDALVRADSQAQANVASVYIACRVLNPNEVRAKLGKDPYPGGEIYENPNTSSGAKQAGNTVPDTSKG